MSGITDQMREEMTAITAGISHTRRGPATAKYLRYMNGKAEWSDDPAPVRRHSMFPYRSTAMCIDPEDVPGVSEMLRKQGVFVEFDRAGRPIIESAKQQSDLAKALGMKTGRDGYGHTDEFGRFHNSGRRRAEETASGRKKVRQAIDKLNTMPDDTPVAYVDAVLREYDITPNDANTG